MKAYLNKSFKLVNRIEKMVLPLLAVVVVTFMLVSHKTYVTSWVVSIFGTLVLMENSVHIDFHSGENRSLCIFPITKKDYVKYNFVTSLVFIAIMSVVGYLFMIVVSKIINENSNYPLGYFCYIVLLNIVLQQLILLMYYTVKNKNVRRVVAAFAPVSTYIFAPYAIVFEVYGIFSIVLLLLIPVIYFLSVYIYTRSDI